MHRLMWGHDMGKLKWLGVAGVVALAVPMAFVITFFSTGGIFKCDDHPISARMSPAKDATIIIFETDCGATTRVTTHVSITRDPSDLVGGYDLLIVEGRQDFRARWITEDRIEITAVDSYLESEQVFLKRDTWRDKNISFLNIDDPLESVDSTN